MSCQKCGRSDGHHLGCEVPSRQVRLVPKPDARPVEEAVTEELERLARCEHGECSNPKRPPQGKGPRPKYCDEHSTPKSRKE